MSACNNEDGKISILAASSKLLPMLWMQLQNARLSKLGTATLRWQACSNWEGKEDENYVRNANIASVTDKIEMTNAKCRHIKRSAGTCPQRSASRPPFISSSVPICQTVSAIDQTGPTPNVIGFCVWGVSDSVPQVPETVRRRGKMQTCQRIAPKAKVVDRTCLSLPPQTLTFPLSPRDDV